jgi:hypothetical protein
MIATVHQPMFLQYLGLFRKALLSDIFIVYDTAQYSKNDWHNRNKIKTAHGPAWLSVPVSYHLGDSFRVAQPNGMQFIESHLSIIKQAYSTTPHFKEIFPVIEAAYRKSFSSLAEFNWNLQEAIFKLLEINPKIYFSSDLNVSVKATKALVEMCTLVGADTYIAGLDASYMDLALFKSAGITVKTNDFIARPYPQQGNDVFMPNLSVIDALFNIGAKETRKLIS